MTCPNYNGLVVRNKIKCRLLFTPGNARTCAVNFSPSNFYDYPYAYTHINNATSGSVNTLKTVWTPVSVCPVNISRMLSRADAIAYDIHSRVTGMRIKQFPYTMNPRSSTSSIPRSKEYIQLFLPHQHFTDGDSGLIDLDSLPFKPSMSSELIIIPNTMGRYDVGWTIARPWPWNDQNLSNHHIPLSTLHAFYYGGVGSANLIQRSMVYEVTYIVETMFKECDIGLGWYNDSAAVMLNVNLRALELYNRFTFFDFPDVDAYYRRLNCVSREFNHSPKTVRCALFPFCDDPILYEYFHPDAGLIQEVDEDVTDLCG